MARFGSTKPEKSLAESKVLTQAHADTCAGAALTKSQMEFLTAEVEIRGDPACKPGAMVNIKKVGIYSGKYVVTEADHFYDAAGYNTVFYIARDKWGDSSNTDTDASTTNQDNDASTDGNDPTGAGAQTGDGQQFIDFILEDDNEKPIANAKIRIHIPGQPPTDTTSGSDGHVHIDKIDEGNYTVELLDDGTPLTFIDVTVINANDNRPLVGLVGHVELSDGSKVNVITDAFGNVRLDDVPAGKYVFQLGQVDGSGAGSGDSSGDGPRLTTIDLDIVGEDDDQPIAGISGTVTLSDGKLQVGHHRHPRPHPPRRRCPKGVHAHARHPGSDRRRFRRRHGQRLGRRH